MKKLIIIGTLVVALSLGMVFAVSAFADNRGNNRGDNIANGSGDRQGGIMGRYDENFADYDEADLISSETAAALAQDYIESNGLEGYTIEERTFDDSISDVHRFYVYEVTDGDQFVGMIHIDGITSEVNYREMPADGPMGGRGHMGGRSYNQDNSDGRAYGDCPMFDDDEASSAL